MFGGGTTGLMGEVAKTLVNLSGPDAAHGIIPKALMAFERQYTNDEDSTAYGMEEQKKKDLAQFGRTTVVDDMHTRKQTMVNAVLSGGPGSGFVALSGGYGTLEELAEVSCFRELYEQVLSNTARRSRHGISLESTKSQSCCSMSRAIGMAF